MNKFIRYWNQNRNDIIKLIAIIAFIIIIIQLLNKMLVNSNKNKTEIQNETTIKDVKKPTQSVITGQKVSKAQTEENTNVIEQFVNNCNNREFEKAYALLSDECKAEFNNDINLFKSNYYNKIFDKAKTYSLELWLISQDTYTYQIKYYENNLLATGGSSMNNNIEDYMTIVTEKR